MIVTDVGTAGVRVLLIRSLRTDRDLKPFGVTRQEQHEIISSAGSKVYTLIHMFPVLVRPVGSVNVPVFVRLMTESPMFKFDA